MHEEFDIAQSFLGKIGGELLEGSGFEDEVPDPSFTTDDTPSKPKRSHSATREERGDAE